MTPVRIVIIGAGGHASVLAEALASTRRFAIEGFIAPSPAGTAVLGWPVLGGDEILPRLRREGVEAAALGLGGNALRARVAAELSALGFVLPPVVHASALVSPSATLGPGAVVMARAVVGTRTRIGTAAIVNSGAVVDHDGDVGDGAHVAPGVAIAGSVTIGPRALVGVGSSVRPGIRIGADAVVGAGSAVVRDIEDGATVGGAPARRLPAAAGSRS